MDKESKLNMSKFIISVLTVTVFVVGVFPLGIVLSYHLAPGSVMTVGTESYIFMFLVAGTVFIALLLLRIQLGRMAKDLVMVQK